MDYATLISIFKRGQKIINTLIFLWLQNQTFYRALQRSAVEPLGSTNKANQTWADIGCSTGLLTRLVHQLNYHVTGYDLNTLSLKVAKLLSLHQKNIDYKNKDFNTLDEKFDVISATSLLSVVEDKKQSLNKLITMLKNSDSTLILIEPTEKLSVKNVYTLIHDIKTFWFYKGLLLWAKAREGKAIPESLFENIDAVNIQHTYYISDMVRITYIKKS